MIKMKPSLKRIHSRFGPYTKVECKVSPHVFDTVIWSTKNSMSHVLKSSTVHSIRVVVRVSLNND